MPGSARITDPHLIPLGLRSRNGPRSTQSGARITNSRTRRQVSLRVWPINLWQEQHLCRKCLRSMTHGSQPSFRESKMPILSVPWSSTQRSSVSLQNAPAFFASSLTQRLCLAGLHSAFGVDLHSRNFSNQYTSMLTTITTYETQRHSALSSPCTALRELHVPKSFWPAQRSRAGAATEMCQARSAMEDGVDKTQYSAAAVGPRELLRACQPFSVCCKW
jgi:hypothetical protein